MLLINIINIQLVQSANARGADCSIFIINVNVSELYNISQVLVNTINIEYRRPCFYTSYLHIYVRNASWVHDSKLMHTGIVPVQW